MRADPHHLGERKFLEYPLFLSTDANDHHHVLRVALWSLVVTTALVGIAALIFG
jgi:hypothetical protein